MWVDVFRTGTFLNDDGSSTEWTEHELDEIVDKYNNQSENKHTAPVVFGHPKDDAPAVGWVERLKRDGNVLKAKLVDLSKELIDGIKTGAYKFQSIALYPDKLFRHLGILGAMPPKVKGLKPLTEYFSDNNYSTYNTIYFSDFDLSTLDEGWVKAIRAEVSEELFQKILTNYIELINKTKKVEDMNNTEKKQDTTFSETNFIELKKHFDEQKELLNKAMQQIEVLSAEKKDLKFEQVFSELKTEGYVTPAQRDLFKAIYEQKGYTFSENGQKVEEDYNQTLIKLIKTFPKQVEFAEVVKPQNDEESEFLKYIKGVK